MIRVAFAETPFRRELVNTARADRGTGLASKHKSMSHLIVDLYIIPWMIIDSNDIINIDKPIVKGIADIIKTAGHRTGRIFPMAYILKELTGLPTIVNPLRRHFIAHTPHHH